MVNVTIDLGGFFRAWKEWNESRERERIMAIARASMRLSLIKLQIFDEEGYDYYFEIDSIEVDIYTATTREHCQEIMERIKALAKQRN